MTENPTPSQPTTTAEPVAEPVPTETPAAPTTEWPVAPPRPPLPRRQPRRRRQSRLPLTPAGHPVEPGRAPRTELRGRHRVLHRRHRQHDPDHRRGEGQRARLLRRRADQPDREGQERRPSCAFGVVAFRDFVADGDAALEESPFYTLPAERAGFSEFVNGLIAQGGGDAPESGLEAVALAINSPWTTTGDRRRQVIVVWTDQPAQPLDPSVVPADLASRVPADFSALTDVWEDEQGLMGSSSKRLILFAPGRPGLERHLRRLGERGAPPVAGRRRSVRGRLRHDHRLHRQLGVSEPDGDTGTGGVRRDRRADPLVRLQPGQDPRPGRGLRPDPPRRARPGSGRGVRRHGRGRRHGLRDPRRAAYRRLPGVPDRPGRGRAADAGPARARLEPERARRPPRISAGRSSRRCRNGSPS